MNVALVYPEVYDVARFKEKRKEFPPFGVLYLAAVLEQAGHKVRVERISISDVVRDFTDSDVVGFSIPSSATLEIVRDCRELSLYKSGALVLAGGVHANLYPEHAFEFIHPDVLSIGESEETILEIVSHFLDKEFKQIDGIMFSDSGEIQRTKARSAVLEISELPLPARHLLPREDVIMMDRLSNTNLRMAHVMFSRGCPFPCRFCAVAQTKIQYRSGLSARSELIHLRERYQIDGFAIVDDNFIVDRRKVFEICNAISDLNLKWSALSRVDTVRQDLLEVMRDSGCIEIKYGMESGSERILRAMNKRISIDTIYEAVKMTYDIGINVKLFVIHGYPGEDMESTLETLTLLKSMQHMVERVSLFRFVPLPGTYVYKNPSEFDLHGTDKDPDWDGRWSKFHIHHNDYHWWGTEAQFREVTEAFSMLNSYIESVWG